MEIIKSIISHFNDTAAKCYEDYSNEECIDQATKVILFIGGIVLAFSGTALLIQKLRPRIVEDQSGTNSQVNDLVSKRLARLEEENASLRAEVADLHSKCNDLNTFCNLSANHQNLPYKSYFSWWPKHSSAKRVDEGRSIIG